MEKYGICAYCRRRYQKNQRVKRQLYCGHKACQLARKRRWQRHKMTTDPDYRLNQQDCMRRWRKRHSHYWQHYRKSHPSYTTTNRILQKLRNLNRPGHPLIAKMDSIIAEKTVIPGIYYILRKCRQIAKMDTLFQKVFIYPAGCLKPVLIAKLDSIATILCWSYSWEQARGTMADMSVKSKKLLKRVVGYYRHSLSADSQG